MFRTPTPTGNPGGRCQLWKARLPRHRTWDRERQRNFSPDENKSDRRSSQLIHRPFNLHNLHHRHRHLWSSFSNHVSPLRRSTNGSFCLLHAHNLSADRRCLHTWSKLDTSLISIFPCLDLNWKILRQLRRTSLDWLARWKIMEIGVWPSKATPPKRNPKCEASSCANFCFAVSSPRHQNFWFSFYRESEAARKSQPTLGGVGASSIAEKKMWIEIVYEEARITRHTRTNTHAIARLQASKTKAK